MPKIPLSKNVFDTVITFETQPCMHNLPMTNVLALTCAETVLYESLQR